VQGRSQEFILGWAGISSKFRRYEKISLNRKKNTPSQGGHNEPYPSMHILYIKKKKKKKKKKKQKIMHINQQTIHKLINQV
jgi:hypothetical protein